MKTLFINSYQWIKISFIQIDFLNIFFVLFWVLSSPLTHISDVLVWEEKYLKIFCFLTWKHTLMNGIEKARQDNLSQPSHSCKNLYQRNCKITNALLRIKENRQKPIESSIHFPAMASQMILEFLLIGRMTMTFPIIAS